MFWTETWDHGLKFGDNLRSQGSTLVAVPLTFVRPLAGIEFRIPSPLLTFRGRMNPDGSPSSGMWNNTRKEWHDRSSPGTSWLHFQIPPELLPLAITRAQIGVKVTGPIGRFEVLGLKQGKVVSLETIVDPVGAFSIPILDSDVLSIAEESGLAIGISGGDPSRPELTHTKSEPKKELRSATSASSNDSNSDMSAKVNYWRIESLGLQLWAKTLDQSAKD